MIFLILFSGMLAARGLLNCENKQQYSSSSEESDTEEYKRIRDNINPITGVYEPPRPDPTQGKLELGGFTCGDCL